MQKIYFTRYFQIDQDFLEQKKDNYIIRHDFYELYKFDLIRIIKEYV